jgi:subtilisin family serine protease
MEKLTMAGVVFELLIIWWISPVPEVTAIVTPGGRLGTFHAKVVPGTDEVKTISAWNPEQIDRVDGVAITSGNGVTVTVFVAGLAALHPLASE